jgi:hypothetical protein
MISDNQGKRPTGEGTDKETTMTNVGGRKEVRRKGPVESDMAIVSKTSGTTMISIGEGSSFFPDSCTSWIM